MISLIGLLKLVLRTFYLILFTIVKRNVSSSEFLKDEKICIENLCVFHTRSRYNFMTQLYYIIKLLELTLIILMPQIATSLNAPRNDVYFLLKTLYFVPRTSYLILKTSPNNSASKTYNSVILFSFIIVITPSLSNIKPTNHGKHH